MGWYGLRCCHQYEKQDFDPQICKFGISALQSAWYLGDVTVGWRRGYLFVLQFCCQAIQVWFMLYQDHQYYLSHISTSRWICQCLVPASSGALRQGTQETSEQDKFWPCTLFLPKAKYISQYSGLACLGEGSEQLPGACKYWHESAVLKTMCFKV